MREGVSILQNLVTSDMFVRHIATSAEKNHILLELRRGVVSILLNLVRSGVDIRLLKFSTQGKRGNQVTLNE